MRKLKVDLERLADAMDDPDLSRMYFLRLETGELLSAVAGPDETAEDTELFERMDDEPEGYEQVRRTRPESAYSDMDDFVRALAEKSLAASLLAAIRGRRAVEEFNGVLAATPGAERRWADFRESKRRERAVRWLKGVGVEPV